MWQVTLDELEQLLASSDVVYDFIEAHFPEEYDDDFEDNGIDFGKAWHLLHYFITGEIGDAEYPLGHAVLGGYCLNESWDGLSYLSPDDVVKVEAALSALSETDFYKKCTSDSTPELEIYKFPSISNEDVEESIEDFKRLKAYYRDAAKNGNALIRHLN